MAFDHFKYIRIPKFISFLRQLGTFSTVHSRGLTLNFVSDNWITKYRSRTFNEKESEMLDWLDEKLDNKAVFFDVGANVGIYTIYAAKRNRNSQIVAFEPEYSNLHLLKQNILNNQLLNKIQIFSIALNEESGISFLHIQDETPGAALSTVSDDDISETATGHKVIWKEGIAVMSLDEFCDQVGIQPTIIKIDVDGNELAILKGGLKTFNNPVLKSIYIEIDEENDSECEKKLKKFGFKQTKISGQNQIWDKI